jgi:hypothetical protein
MRAIVRLLVNLAVSFGVYWFVFRPRQARWGALDDEVSTPLPGDDIAPSPTTQVTHAITINAPPSAVWAWLIQMGQEKAGLYSYEWMENLIGCDIHNTYEIKPEWQNTQVNDTVRLGPKGYPLYVVKEIVPNKALVLQAADPKTELSVPASWAFVLNAQADGTTRLIVRSRNQYEPSIGNFILWRMITEPLSFIMERKMLRRIKELSEAQRVLQPQAA